MAKYFIPILLVIGSAFSGRVDSLLILHTNDLHGHISSQGKYPWAARIAKYFKKKKYLRPDVLILDAGDVITGAINL